MLHGLFKLFRVLLHRLRKGIPALFRCQLHVFFGFAALLLLVALVRFSFLLRQPFGIDFGSLIEGAAARRRLKAVPPGCFRPLKLAHRHRNCQLLHRHQITADPCCLHRLHAGS